MSATQKSKEIFTDNPEAKIVAMNLIRERIDSGETVDFEVASNSMGPLLKCGDAVSVCKVKSQDLLKGDLILYDAGNVFYVHRYIGTEIYGADCNVFITKGDNIFDFDDEKIKEHQLIGKVVSVKSNGKVIDASSRKWIVANAMMTFFSVAQARTLKFLQESRRVILKNRVFKPGEYIRDAICSLFYVIQKIIVLLCRDITSAGKKD